MVFGEALYVDKANNVHLAGDLGLLRLDGTVEPVEGEMKPKPSRPIPTDHGAHILKALEYAQWILQSNHDPSNWELDAITHVRI